MDLIKKFFLEHMSYTNTNPESNIYFLPELVSHSKTVHKFSQPEETTVRDAYMSLLHENSSTII